MKKNLHSQPNHNKFNIKLSSNVNAPLCNCSRLIESFRTHKRLYAYHYKCYWQSRNWFLMSQIKWQADIIALTEEKKIFHMISHEFCKAPKQRLTFEIHPRRCSQLSRKMQESYSREMLTISTLSDWVEPCLRISKGLFVVASKRENKRLPLPGAWNFMCFYPIEQMEF